MTKLLALALADVMFVGDDTREESAVLIGVDSAESRLRASDKAKGREGGGGGEGLCQLSGSRRKCSVKGAPEGHGPEDIRRSVTGRAAGSGTIRNGHGRLESDRVRGDNCRRRA